MFSTEAPIRPARRPLTLVELKEGSPYQPPDWRWQSANRLLLHEQRRYRQFRSDPWVRRALQFQRKCRNSTGEFARNVGAREPGIVGALAIQANENQRHEIQARVLANQSREVIAERCGIPVEILEVWEALFFDVRRFLTATSWVLHQVIGPKIHTGLTMADTDVIAKLFAFTMGPFVLDVFLEALRAGHLDRTWDDPNDSDLPRLSRSIRMLLAVMTLQVDGSSLPKLIALMHRMEELDRDAEGRTASAACGPMEASPVPPAANVPERKSASASWALSLESERAEDEHGIGQSAMTSLAARDRRPESSMGDAGPAAIHPAAVPTKATPSTPKEHARRATRYAQR